MMSEKATGSEVISDFADQTTAHGFANVKNSESWFGTGIWILALLAAWAVCCYQLAINIDVYLQYPTTTSVSLTHSSDAQFPAVSICNLNSIRWQMMVDNSECNYTQQANILKTAKASAISWNNFDTSGSQAPPDTPYGYLPSVTKFNSLELQTECSFKLDHMRDVYNLKMDVSLLGHQLENMLLDCSFQGRQCMPMNFTKWQHGSYGNCYTIVVDSKSFPSFVGPDYGLSLTLFTEEQQYLPMITPAAGFRIELHSPVYMPFPEDLGFTISPGFLTSAAVQQRLITRQPLPYDGIDCGRSLKFQNMMSLPNVYDSWSDVVMNSGFNSSALNYTNQACMKSCYQIKLAKRCGCINAAYVTLDQMGRTYGNMSAPPACDQSLYNVSCCIVDSINTIDTECNAMCYQPCMEEDFDARITTSLWPRSAYFETIQPAWSARNPLIGNMTAEDARNQIAKLEVYFRVLNYEAITESVAISLFDLLTNVGGTLGLYGGLSFLTILEFLECFARYCSSKTKCRHGQASRVSTSSTFGDAPTTVHYPVKTSTD